jgi:Pro-kumamolisin, activation domain
VRIRTLLSWLVPAVLLVLSSFPARANTALAAPAGPKTLVGTEPDVVAHGAAQLLGHRAASESVDFSVGLPLRDVAGLDAFLQDVNNPAGSRYHHYLTQDEANAQFNPTADSETRVVHWLQAHGMTVTATYANHLMVSARGTVANVEHLFGVSLNTYRATIRGKQQDFSAPDGNPVIDSSVSDVVGSVVGLDTYPRFHTGLSLSSNGTLHNLPPYFPQDIATAYDVAPLWSNGYTGTGQHIAITLWMAPPSDTTLQQWGTTTGAAVATTANKRLNVIHVCDGTNCASTAADVGEAAMDIEWSGAMAPNATIDYYEAPTDSSGNPTAQGLLNALNSAGSDANNNGQISNSWSECEASSTGDGFTSQAESIFATNSATGHNYFFSTGDNGSWCGSQDPQANFPASSPYVTAVGGSRFTARLNGGYPGETAWAYTAGNAATSSTPVGSGGGYSGIFNRPPWQTGGGLAANGKRAYPDVSAIADPATGVYVCYGATPVCANQWGGTSLSSPVLAGMTALFNQYLVGQGKPTLGFLDPVLYNLQNVTQSYPAFHDITSGTNGGYNAGTGWDAVTGEGTPDAWNIARDLAGTAPSTATPTATPTSTTGGATPTITPTSVPTVSTPTATPSATPVPTANGSGTTISTAVSTQQYTMTGSDGNTWTDMDPAKLALTLTPNANSTVILSGNSDLWTSTVGYNQDIGLWISGGSFGSGQLVAWKESGGPARNSPNAAYVQTVVNLTAGTTYTVRLRWKANTSDAGTIWAGAGPSAPFSPTRLTGELLPATTIVNSAVSTQQYTLTGSDGTTWTDMDASKLLLAVTPGVSSTVILSANSDLWTSAVGYNQDLGIWISGGSYGSGQLLAWKESGGPAKNSPNAAFLHTIVNLAAGTTYTVKLQWKANTSDPGTIWAGAGPSGPFSPTRLTAELVPSSTSVSTAMSTQQYKLTGNDGNTWSTMDATNLSMTLNPTSASTGILSGNSDLWTSNVGYNQDMGIWVSGGSFGSGQLVAWKESGGAGVSSPNAAYVQAIVSLAAGTSYTVRLMWKANTSDPATIWSGGGPINGAFSPTRLAAEVLPGTVSIPPTATPSPTPLPTSTPTSTSTTTSCPGSQSGCIGAMLNILNNDRAAAGSAPLALNNTETNGTGTCVGSYGHSVHMASLGAISHDQFPADICIAYSMAGENVGQAGYGNELTDLQKLDQSMMSEPHDPTTCSTTGNHACNTINPGYHQVGIGIYYINNQTWLTEDFTN